MANGKPVTNALILWIVVGVAALTLIYMVGYTLLLMQVNRSIPVVYPPTRAMMGVRAPSTFGRILEISPIGTLTLDTKQKFGTVMVDEVTRVTKVNGARINWTELRAGDLITATGQLREHDSILADALVVIEQAPAGQAPPVSGALTLGSTAMKDWEAAPALIGWGSGPEAPVAAVRAYAPLVPNISIELYGADGKVSDRIEIRADDYARMKPLNPFLTPDEAVKALGDKNVAVGGENVTSSLAFESASGEGVKLIAPQQEKKLGLKLSYGGKEIAAVKYVDISFTQYFPEAPIYGSYFVSPDKKWLLAVFTAPHAEFGPLRSVHLIDLEKLGVK